MSADLEKHLKELLDSAVESHGTRKNTLRRASWFLHISAMVLGGVSTILLGLQIDSETYATVSRNVALVIVALTTLIASLLTYWNLDAYWLKRKVIYNDLVALRERFNYLRASDPEDKRAQLDKIFDDYMQLTGSHAEYWQSVLAREVGKAVAPRDSDQSN
ncbi:SLATT domain-containing protein [Nocardia beijingensis]|uniref:SLATT domain-containing protein n=1 Tax=Nocardia beijingensis TaxID=95162 RepID=UPI000831AA35|nr:SLATT domain-containing protein [Nocardia beijingensis]